MKTKALLLIVLVNGIVWGDSSALNKVKKSVWRGVPDANYVWEGDRLSYERTVKDENGKEKIIKTFRDPIEIIADFKAESKVYGIEGKIERAAIKKFGGALKGFVWLKNVRGGGEVILPFTAPHIFIARGDRLDPTLTEIDTDPNDDNYYETINGKTRVVVKSFSGVGGAAGSPAALIAQYRMNDYLDTDVVLDETGNHNGVVKDAGGTATSAFHSVAGKIFRAQDFDGTDDYIEIPDDDDFTPSGAFSFSIWVNIGDASSCPFVEKGTYNVDGEFRFQTTGADKITVRRYDESVDNCYLGRTYGTALTTYEGQWIHLVWTTDGGTLSAGDRIYLNGVRVDDDNHQFNPASFEAVENGDHATWFGRSHTGYGEFIIDNVMIFSTVLDAFEVRDLYNMGAGTEHPAELRNERLAISRRRR